MTLGQEIVIGNLVLTEVMTFVTDVLISLVCLYAYRKLRKQKYERKEAHHWSNFFLWMSIASFIGGLSHLFFNYTGMPLKFASWLLITLSVYFGEQGTIVLIKNEKLKNILNIGSIVKLVLISILIPIIGEFSICSAGVAAGLFGMVTTLHATNYFSTKQKGSGLIALGISINLFALLFRVKEISFHHWFNYNDIAHVILALSCYIIYKGSKRKVALS